MWAAILTANKVSVVVGTFPDYDTAQDWAKAHRRAHKVSVKIVVFYKPKAYD
jgi:hypothetical protein